MLSSNVTNATQGSVISKTVWVAKTTAAIVEPKMAGAVKTVKTVKTVWGQWAGNRMKSNEILGCNRMNLGGSSVC